MSYFVPYIDGNGIHMPTYEDRLDDLVEAYRTIFGIDAALSPAVPDYQLLSVIAKSLDDTASLVVQNYNSRNPQYATGAALDLLLPQYGLSRATGESDADARAKITQSLASRGIGSADAIVAAVKNVQYVKDAKVFVNNTNSTDSMGIPAHSIALVSKNGANANIAQALFNKKSPGIGTYGTTTANAVDSEGNQIPMSFTKASGKYVYVYMFIQLLNGLNQQTVIDAIQTPILNFINTLKIGQSFIIPQLYGVAYAANPEIAKDFIILDIQVALPGGQSVIRDRITADWNEYIYCLPNGGMSYTWY